MEGIQKTKGLVNLEKQVIQHPERYQIQWNSDGSLHSATHLDSGILMIVEADNDMKFLIWIS